MPIRRHAALAACLAALAAPASAQAPDFGADTSMWARDGECDDPRFQGAGMAAGPLAEGDRLADASDCRAAFQAGRVTLAGAAPPVKGTPATGGAPAGQVTIDFGNDSSEWARDGECDDRRFVGDGMASSLGWANTGRDATDCLALWDARRITNWDWTAARTATQCEAIDFGDDAGEFANDGECDDARFEGLAMPAGVSDAHVGHDAADCSQLCAFGVIALRDY